MNGICQADQVEEWGRHSGLRNSMSEGTEARVCESRTGRLTSLVVLLAWAPGAVAGEGRTGRMRKGN